MKTIEMPDGSVIKDLGRNEELVIFSKEIVEQKAAMPSYKYKKYLANCKKFRTKSGRPAIRITVGDEFEVEEGSGEGDRTWGYWERRKPINAFFAKAVATTNGGGCWYEIVVKRAGADIKTAEQQAYEDEITEIDDISRTRGDDETSNSME